MTQAWTVKTILDLSPLAQRIRPACYHQSKGRRILARAAIIPHPHDHRLPSRFAVRSRRQSRAARTSCACSRRHRHPHPRFPRVLQSQSCWSRSRHRLGRLLSRLDAVRYLHFAARPARHAPWHRPYLRRCRRPQPGARAHFRRAHEAHRRSPSCTGRWPLSIGILGGLAAIALGAVWLALRTNLLTVSLALLTAFTSQMWSCKLCPRCRSLLSRGSPRCLRQTRTPCQCHKRAMPRKCRLKFGLPCLREGSCQIRPRTCAGSRHRRPRTTCRWLHRRKGTNKCEFFGPDSEAVL